MIYLLCTVSICVILFSTQVAELLGFHAGITSCLDYLEAAPWVGEDEENVVPSIRELGMQYQRVNPLLKRVTSVVTNPPNETSRNEISGLEAFQGEQHLCQYTNRLLCHD
jgi:hypothetical protein